MALRTCLTEKPSEVSSLKAKIRKPRSLLKKWSYRNNHRKSLPLGQGEAKNANKPRSSRRDVPMLCSSSGAHLQALVSKNCLASVGEFHRLVTWASETEKLGSTAAKAGLPQRRRQNAQKPTGLSGTRTPRSLPSRSPYFFSP